MNRRVASEKQIQQPRRGRDGIESQGSKPQRDNILDCAARLFSRKSYLGTSMSDLAKEAGINQATIYYYFDRKETILHEILVKLDQDLLASIPFLRSDGTPLERLKAMVISHVEFLIDRAETIITGDRERINLSPELLRSYVAMRDQYEAHFRETIAEGIAQGVFRRMNPRLASVFMLSFLNSLINWYKPGAECSREEVASEAWLSVAGMLGVPLDDRVSEPPKS